MAQYLSSQDYSDYGNDLVTFAKKAALESVSPHIENLQNQNYALRDHLAIQARHSLDQRVASLLPDYAERDQDPRWHEWLRQRDNLSGRVRQELLNDAIASTDAHRVVAFFRSFQRENQATAQATGQASPAYGRTRPERARSDGPIYTGTQIQHLYRMHQRGAYNGREAEWAKQEADIFRAQREGRVMGGKDVQGK
jgi:hypothetical protein